MTRRCDIMNSYGDFTHLGMDAHSLWRAKICWFLWHFSKATHTHQLIGTNVLRHLSILFMENGRGCRPHPQKCYTIIIIISTNCYIPIDSHTRCQTHKRSIYTKWTSEQHDVAFVRCARKGAAFAHIHTALSITNWLWNVNFRKSKDFINLLPNISGESQNMLRS